MTRISVVTVCKNAAPSVESTLASVRKQTHGDVEHVVIDGGSTDGTLQIIERYRDAVATLVSEPDRGLYHAMNKGWQRASGRIIGFLNAGDTFHDPEVLSRVAAAFEQSACDAVYGDLDLVSNDGRVVRKWRSGPFRRSKYHFGWMTPHPATYIRRELFERYGGFRHDLSIAADYELMLRFFFEHRARVQYLRLPLVRMVHGGASNGTFLGVMRANWQVYRSWRKNGLFTLPIIMITKPLSKLLQLRF